MTAIEDGVKPSGVSLANIQSDLDKRFSQEDLEILSTYSAVGFQSSATGDAYGSYAEIINTIGANPIVILGIQITKIQADSSSNVNIATGIAESEVSLCTIGFYNTNISLVGVYQSQFFPVFIRIPAGTRLSVRAKDNVASALTYVINIYYRRGS